MTEVASDWERRLEQALAEEGITKSDFARRVGRTYRSVARWFKDGTVPKDDALQRFEAMGSRFAALAAELPAQRRAGADVLGRTDLTAGLAKLEETVDRLVVAVEALERRVGVLERRRGRRAG